MKERRKQEQLPPWYKDPYGLVVLGRLVRLGAAVLVLWAVIELIITGAADGPLHVYQQQGRP